MYNAPASIDEVIQQLDDIILSSLRKSARIGLFAALYQRVTINVKRAIVAGRVFQDNDRMAKLDVVFAGRFLEAWNAHCDGRAPTQSWQVCFEALSDDSPLAIQHLLLGMNAHINLDLGIAAAVVAPGDELEALRTDFMKINAVLERLMGVVEVSLGEISPRLRRIETLSGRLDDRIFNFCIDVARDEAWALARELAWLPQSAWEPVIERRDREVAALGEALYRPHLATRPIVEWIRAAESNDISYVIQVVGQ